MDHSDICNYADDNSLTVADISIDNIIAKLESDIESLDQWFKCNCMLLNQSKCNFMIIESKRTESNEKAKIKLSDKHLEENTRGKLLGINFDKNLTMSEHIKQLCKVASNKLYALARISQYIDEQKKKSSMKSFITFSTHWQSSDCLGGQ